MARSSSAKKENFVVVNRPDAPAATIELWLVAKMLRPHQWSKNALLLLPALLGHRIFEWSILRGCVVAFVTFSLCASSVYVFNDLVDLERDRRHPEKKHRPFASGKLPVWAGYWGIAICLTLALGLSLWYLPSVYTGMLVGYSLLTLVYSLFLNKEPIIDVLLLTSFYVIRLLAGGAAVGVRLSPWFMAFSFFFFLGLAFLKRYVELEKWSHERKQMGNRAGYVLGDRWILQVTGVTSGFLSILIFCLYLNSPDVMKLYTHPNILWGVSPLLAYWVSHLWFRAQRGVVNTDPVVFALRDKYSLATAAALAGLLYVAL